MSYFTNNKLRNSGASSEVGRTHTHSLSIGSRLPQVEGLKVFLSMAQAVARLTHNDTPGILY